MVELRKRKAPVQPPAPVKKSKKTQAPATTAKKSSPKEEKTSATASIDIPKVGDTVDLNTFGGDIETYDGTKTTLKTLVDESKAGIALFTYPKASTPGCTKQVCLFRDRYDHLTSTGLSIYGLSADSPKANTTFKTKQNLPYSLLCDTTSRLIAAIGLKKAPRGTARGVFVIDKQGKVLILQTGGPDATVDAVQELVTSSLKENNEKSAD